MNKKELTEFLNSKAQQYESPKFISSDPIQIPHLFSQKEDIEISAFLVATIAWGNRMSIIKSGKKMMELMDYSPAEFVRNHQTHDLNRLKGFVHRTFNADDFSYFLVALQKLYLNYGGLEMAFQKQNKSDNLQTTISYFKTLFFSFPHLKRTEKHLSDPLKNSAAKRINMFLRWMVRPNTKGVDFGLWKSIHPRQLSCPLDIHTGNVARKLGLLNRKQNDAKALLLLDMELRKIDARDPVKFDFALFGLGAF